MLICLRKILRILKRCVGPCVAVAPPGRVQVDTGQKRGEIGGGHLDPAVRGVGDAEGPAFESLRPDGQAVTVPIEHLDTIAPLVDKNEEVTGERIEGQRTSDQGGKTIEAFPHIGRIFGEVHPYGGAQSEHGVSSTTAMSWRRVW